MPLDWSPLVEFVNGHKHILLTTHVRPDGDGLGSILAFGEALDRLGKQVQLVIASVLPPRYAFLDPKKKINVFVPPGERQRECDAIVVMDTGTWNQLAEVGDFIRASSADRIVIDHHRTQDDLGGRAFVDVDAEATGRLAFEAIAALKVPVTPSMANNMFVALAMDTGWFRHSNANTATFALAANLVAAGATPTTNYEELFERSSLPRLALTGRMLSRVQTRADGRIAFSEVRFSDYGETGAYPLDTEDMINYLRSIEGVEIAFLLLEQRDGSVKVSFRSRTANVAKLAEQYSGGGHKLASGATLSGPLGTAREAVPEAAISALC